MLTKWYAITVDQTSGRLTIVPLGEHEDLNGATAKLLKITDSNTLILEIKCSGQPD